MGWGFFVNQLTEELCSVLILTSSKQIGKPAVLHATELPAQHTTYLGCSTGNH